MKNTTKTPELNDTEISFARVSFGKRLVRTKAFPLFVLLIVAIAVFAILSPMRNDGFQAFFRVKTIWRVLQDFAVTGFLAIGVGLLIVSGNIDLSSATVGSMGGVIIAVMISWYNIPWGWAIVTALGVAVLVGFINGFLVNELKQPPFIATMAMSTILTAVMQIIATDKTGQINGSISFSHEAYAEIALSKVFGEINVVSLVMVLCFVVYGLALSKSKFGRTLYLMGGNSSAAHLAGVNAKATTYFLFVNASVLGSIAGIVNSSRVMSGSTMALMNSQFSGMTAAILGGISFGGGSGGMGGAFLGLLVIQTFNMGMATSGGSPYLTPVLSGALLLVALTFDYFNTRAQNKRVGA
ncbi:MAG: ABC transporter permease [Synergistaceae bacterium]|jgi:ribose/xylose/arabinose/galactoside ABC-type transport system permease subunit|nr:ABC transporter permease [Synergistaceae bacterium]